MHRFVNCIDLVTQGAWAYRYAACRAVHDMLPALMQLLSELEASNNAKRGVEARSLLTALDSRFVLIYV